MSNSKHDNLNATPGLLHADASSATLVFYLKFFFAIWFIRYLLDPLPGLSDLPLEYANPVGPLQWIPLGWYQAIHSFWGLATLKFVILCCCIGVWFPRQRIVFAVVGCVSVTLAASIVRGFGHINHAEIGPILITWVLTLFCMRMPKDELRYTSTRKNSTASVAVITAAVVLGLVYAFVGIARLTNGGFELFLGDTIPRHVVKGSHSQWVLPHDLSWVREYPALIWQLKIGTLLVTLVEIATPFALISKRIRYVILLIMPAFHIGAILMFKVIFIEQMLSLVLLINISPWLAQLANRRKSAAPEHDVALAATE